MLDTTEQHGCRSVDLADRERFELSIPLQVCRISSAVHSTALPPVRKAAEHSGEAAPPQAARSWSGQPFDMEICLRSAPKQRQEFDTGGAHLCVQTVGRVDDQQARCRKLAGRIV
jgi:hypothetical protein